MKNMFFIVFQVCNDGESDEIFFYYFGFDSINRYANGNKMSNT